LTELQNRVFFNGKSWFATYLDEKEPLVLLDGTKVYGFKKEFNTPQKKITVLTELGGIILEFKQKLDNNSVCGTNGKYIVGGKETEYPIQGSQTPKVNFTPNEKPPFKFQQKGENIRMMQEYLGIPKNLQTGNFYNKTEQAIKKMFPTYNRSTGVNQDMFDQITGVKQSQQRKTKNTSTIPSERTTQQPQTTVNAAAPTQTSTNLVPNAQQTQSTRKQQRQSNRLARR
jgi:hypothetical protein